ncbi:heme peroxidase [Gigaspora margarita]|uniref:Heme peroxidase n=1 Tax=Gigaspora margarita TaxID=4874 RepID=A0A8H4B2I5_GIGMA|nr:heme peroxidase [Gigaspora margarita]
MSVTWPNQEDYKNNDRITRIAHGSGMFVTWCILFPLSIFVVRYYKHHPLHLKAHRFLQITGSISITSFGTLAMSTYILKATQHYWVALTVFSLSFAIMGTGLLITWGQKALVSVNKGYPRFIKRFHQFSGVTLVLLSW